MTESNSSPIILVPGHWLGAWAWDKVVGHLHNAGCQAIPLTLPGLDPQDPERSSRTLDDQATAIEDALRQAVDAAKQSAVLVAHSGANVPVSLVLDRCPELVCHMVWVDSGPAAPGSIFASGTTDLVEMPLPDFDQLAAQASLEGLDADDLALFRSHAVPEPSLVLRQAVELSNSQRLAVPTTLVCCSMSSTQIMELAHSGHPMFAEVVTLQFYNLVDLPTGHWPMWSRPYELATIITKVAESL
ncbi:MAG: alpha/beta fold hydrolase [Propionibacteriaceae bacterium]|jgi:hypothetical protein|nr:alpha/beta fold hydrolase [Propionibacteriaceae bacterium]